MWLSFLLKKKKVFERTAPYFSLISTAIPSRVQGIWLLTDSGCQRELLPAGTVQATAAQSNEPYCGRHQQLEGQGRNPEDAKSTLCEARIKVSGVADILLLPPVVQGAALMYLVGCDVHNRSPPTHHEQL